ncbi:hypothetical protein GF337_10310 [candidate division KSB1 bacterium]|nr:hypothetical protein [candidate division KSB1 bacterium]
MGISKPNIVKGIPVPLIRPLPTLYYFGRFSNGKQSNEASNYFNGTVDYTCDAIQLLHDQTADETLLQLSRLCSDLKKCAAQETTDCVIDITTKLSKCCSEHSAQIKGNNALSKDHFLSIYKSKVKPLKTLLIDNNNEPDKIERISNTLTNTCFFEVFDTKPNADKYIARINQSDFIVFTSAKPITINEDVQSIQSYEKPFIVLADITKDDVKDQQTLRNGAWLQSRGYEVLYKIFTPLRLFTTIDKMYMKFHLS